MVEIITTNVAASFATVFSKFNLTLSSTPTSDNLTSIDPSRIFFKIEELGFFDPELPIEYGLGDVVKIGKNTIYHSVHLFVQRITDMANIKGDKVVSHNLPFIFEELPWNST